MLDLSLFPGSLTSFQSFLAKYFILLLMSFNIVSKWVILMQRFAPFSNTGHVMVYKQITDGDFQTLAAPDRTNASF